MIQLTALLLVAFALGLLFPRVIHLQVRRHHEYRVNSRPHLKAVKTPTNPSMKAIGGE